MISDSLTDVNSSAQIQLEDELISNGFAMKTIGEIRRLRLEELVQETRSRTLEEVADISGSSAAYLSQVRNRLPDSKTKKPKEMGRKVAERLENAFKKPEGWMDTLNEGFRADIVAPAASVSGAMATLQIHMHPVAGTAQLTDQGRWVELELPAESGDGHVEYPSGDQASYAIRCRGDGMSPRIQDGEFVLVSPNHPYVNGDEVLIRSIDGRVMVKRFLYARDNVAHLGSVNEACQVLKIQENEIQLIHFVSGIARKNLWKQ